MLELLLLEAETISPGNGPLKRLGGTTFGGGPETTGGMLPGPVVGNPAGLATILANVLGGIPGASAPLGTGGAGGLVARTAGNAGAGAAVGFPPGPLPGFACGSCLFVFGFACGAIAGFRQLRKGVITFGKTGLANAL